MLDITPLQPALLGLTNIWNEILRNIEDPKASVWVPRNVAELNRITYLHSFLRYDLDLNTTPLRPAEHIGRATGGRNIVVESDDEIRFSFIQHSLVPDGPGRLAVGTPIRREGNYLETELRSDESCDEIGSFTPTMD